MSSPSSGPASAVQSSACRCCLAEGCDKDMLTQYRCSGVEEVYADMLKETFDLELLLITEDNPDSHHICDECISQLRQAFQFKQRAIRSAGVYQQRLDSQDKTGTGYEESTTQKQEPIDSEDDHLDYEPECHDTEYLENDSDYTPPIKIETDRPVKRKIKPEVNNEPKRAKVFLPECAIKAEDENEENTAKNTETSVKKKKSAVSDKDGDVTVTEDNSVPDDLLMLLEWSNMCLFNYQHRKNKKYYKCFVCTEAFSEVQSLRCHTETHDKSDVVIKVLHSKLDAAITAEISHLKCKCGQSCENLADLMKHLAEVHDVPFENESLDKLETYKIAQNGFSCDFCDTPAFNFFGKLRLHIREAHIQKSANINMCDQCGKVFKGSRTIKQMRHHKQIAHGTKRTKSSKAVDNAIKLICNSNACPFHWPASGADRSTPYKCYCCALHFAQFHQLRAHFAAQHGDAAALYDHISAQGFHNQPLKLDITDLKCAKCDEPCDDLEVLRAHLSERHNVCVEDRGQRILPMRIEIDGCKCPVCGTEFDGWMKLNRHLRLQCEPSSTQRFECRDCSRTFVGRKTWRGHMMRIHSHDKKMNQTTALRANSKILLNNSNMTMFTFDDIAFRCFTCPETFTHFPDLAAHSATHDESTTDLVLKRNCFTIKTDITDLQCNLCQTPFDDINEFAKHLTESHDVKFFNDGKHNLVPYLVRGGLKCGFCKLSFKVIRTLIRHVNTHVSEEFCDICGKMFHQAWALRKHKQRSHGEIKCEECDITFASFDMRRKHNLKFHRGESRRRKHECAICQIHFRNAEMRFKHMKEVHQYRPPEYTCVICVKTYHTKMAYDSHMKSHTKRKATVPCKFCAKSVIKKNLEVHIQTLHIEGLKYRCYVCRKKFASPDLLRDHLVDAHSDTVSYCPLCEFVPDDLQSLVSHLKIVHKIDNKFDSEWAAIRRKKEKPTIVRADRAHNVTEEEIVSACDNIIEVEVEQDGLY